MSKHRDRKQSATSEQERRRLREMAAAGRMSKRTMEEAVDKARPEKPMERPDGPWVALSRQEQQLAYGALQELKYRAEEQDDAPLAEEEEALRVRLAKALGHAVTNERSSK